ncbi:MAG: acyltransferase [Butyrivibrio sp.]|nr:acyltransferase [Butyrivibrio sp.]
MINQKTRSQYLDILKVCACIMVVYVHSGNLFRYAQAQPPVLIPVLSKLAQCGVPIFFIVSGYLAVSLEERPYLEMIKKKMKSLLLPFVIWNLFYFVFEWGALYSAFCV